MFERLQGVLPRRAGQTRFRECRDCGTTLGSLTNTCPVCGSTEIAAYDL